MQNDIYCVDNVVCVSQVLLYPTEFLSFTIPELGYFTKQHNLIFGLNQSIGRCILVIWVLTQS